MLSDKLSIRRYVLSKRDSLREEIRREKDKKIKDKLIGLSGFKAFHKILLYASFRSEVDTIDLVKYCITNGKITVLPKVDKQNNELKLYEIKDMSELSSGYLGILEPDVSEDRLFSVEDMDCIIVPGVAFDEHCNRLGYGKGFYDKLLAKGKRQKAKGVISRQPSAFIIALAYEEQIVESIPAEPHDIRMDRIITDKRIIECYDQ